MNWFPKWSSEEKASLNPTLNLKFFLFLKRVFLSNNVYTFVFVIVIIIIIIIIIFKLSHVDQAGFEFLV